MTAAELNKKIMASFEKHAQEDAEVIRNAVDLQLSKKWVPQGWLSHTYTEDELTAITGEKRLNPLVISHFEFLGFTVTYVPEHSVGHLWWKKRIPPTWTIYSISPIF